METTILIKDDRIQLILQPETGHDKEVCKILEKVPDSFRTQFYDCQGGYSRMTEGDQDLVIVFNIKPGEGGIA